jgi:tryptophanyl-tRNA synthetase
LPCWLRTSYQAANSSKDLAVMAFQERVFSGVQPTGNLHLGNYLGAMV